MKKIMITAMLSSIGFLASAQNTGTTTPATPTQTASAQPDQRSEKTNKDSDWQAYPTGKTSQYRATVLNTNFTIPLVRFNSVNNDNTRKGNVALFNSVGAGFGINWGRLEVTTDNDGKTINTEMNNTFGLHLGFLFAANTNNGNAENIFAPTVSISLLDFHFGYGYELGTITTDQKRGFVTIAYGIPLSKLIKGGFYIWKRTPKPVDDSGSKGVSRFGN